MRILLVAPPGDARVARHRRLLLDTGWKVDVASPRPARPGATPAVHAFYPPRPKSPARPGRAHPDLGASLDLVGRRRVRLAVARTGYRAVAMARTVIGRDLGPGPLALLPPARPASPGPAVESVDDELLAAGFWPEYDLPWLSALTAKLAPDIVHAFDLEGGALLVAYALPIRNGGTTPLVVSLVETATDTAVDGAEATGICSLLASVDGLIVESPSQIAHARSMGFAGDAAAVAPVGGGWPLATTRALRQTGPTSARRILLVDGSHEGGGRPFVALRAIELATDALHGFRIVVHDPGDGVELAARLLAGRTGLRMDVLATTAGDAVLHWHGKARCSVGLRAAISLPPSSLAAMVMGSVPIVGSAVRHDERLGHQETVLFVAPDDPLSVAAALRRVSRDDGLVDAAAAANDRVAERFLERATVGQAIVELYRRVTALGEG